MLGRVAMCNTWWLLPPVFSHQNESHVICMCHVVIFQCNKIAGEDMLFWQCAVMEFLVKEAIPASHVHTWLQHAYGCARIGTQPRLLVCKLPILRQTKENQIACQRESMCDREMVVETGIGHRAVPRKFVRAEFLTCWRKNTDFSEKNVSSQLLESMLSRSINLFMAWWWVMKVFSSLWSGNRMTAWNGITQHCPRKDAEMMPLALKTIVELSFGMLKDAYRPSFCHTSKCPCCLLPSDTPEASLCCMWRMSKEEKDLPATWQHMAPHCCSVHEEDSEE